MYTPKNFIVFIVIMISALDVYGGPYTEPGIPSYIEPNGMPTDPNNPNALINPIFRGWATKVVSYIPTPEVEQRDPCWLDPNMALGPSYSNFNPLQPPTIFDIVSLGDLTEEQIEANIPPGEITLSFEGAIFNGEGYDFAVFENGFPLGVLELYWCELAYVEVSSNGSDFVRFPSVSLVPYDSGGMPPYFRDIEITDVYNLAGKHPNLYIEFTGTGFDLSEISYAPLVLSGYVDLDNINYVKIVDIPGSGDFFDEAIHFGYPSNHPIYDPWVTYDSEGFDLESIGAINLRYFGDLNIDGIVDLEDLSIMSVSWLKQTGQNGWNQKCDIADPKDELVNFLDFAVLAGDWGKVEQWRSEE